MNRNFHLVSALLKGQWAIDPLYAVQHLEWAEKLIDGKDVAGFWDDDDDEEPEPVATLFVLDAGYWRASTDKDPASLQRINFMKVEGPMMKYGSCGSYGTSDYAAALRAANLNKLVVGNVIAWDTPGGQIDGTPSLHDAVGNSTKPTNSLIQDGMMCSAGYWGAAPSKGIYASQPTDIVGSIGVYMTLRDARDYYQKIGVRVTDVYSSKSPQKNIEYRRALEGDFGPLVKRLDGSADVFIKTVKAARGAKLKGKDWNEGAVFSAQEGINVGLLDGMATLDETFSITYDMAQTAKKKSLNFSNTNNANAMGNLVTRALAYISGQSETPEGGQQARDAAITAMGTLAEQAQAQVTNLEQELATARQERDTARQELATAQQGLTTANGTIQTLTAERDEWKEKAETYGSQPGALPTGKATDKKSDEPDKGRKADSTDAYLKSIGM